CQRLDGAFVVIWGSVAALKFHRQIIVENKKTTKNKKPGRSRVFSLGYRSAFAHHDGHIVRGFGQRESLHIDIRLFVACFKIIAFHELGQEVVILHLGEVHANALVVTATEGMELERMLLMLVALW